MIKDLTRGSIFKKLINVSLPIIGGSLFQMGYQLVDMIWLGKLGSSSVAAVGSASFFINLSYSLASMAFIGGGIKVAHSIGRSKKREAFSYSLSAIILTIILSIVISLGIIIFSSKLLGLFNLSEPIFYHGRLYLIIVISFSLFKNLNLTYNRLFVGFGSSRIPFILSSASLLLNIALDPIFIFTLNMGVKGAAIATVTSQVLSATIYTLILFRNLKREIVLLPRVSFTRIYKIFKLSYPVTVQRVVFSLVSIALGKIISTFGADAIAVQKIGIQLESISWITAGGMQGAITSFIGQNYSKGDIKRVTKGYFTGIGIISLVGLIVTLLFILLPGELFRLFVTEKSVISSGISYLKILSMSQIIMCIEITTMGAFNGIGKTHIPPRVSIFFTTLRIPLSLILSPIIGVDGVWFSITITTLLKGSVLFCFFLVDLRRFKNG